MNTNKTLVIGPYKDMSGYGALARAYTKALLKVVDESLISAASLRYDSGSKTQLESELVSAHKRKISSDVDTIVQFATPNEMRAIPGKRSIAICCWETDKIPPLWAIQLNSFDRIIVPCQANKEAFINSGVRSRIDVVKMPAFAEDYNLQNVQGFEIPGCDEDTTIYYNIAQWSHKKGLDAAIRSYFLAFQNNENVLLLLKGYVGMMNQAGDANKLLSSIADIKNAMRLNSYPRLFITDSTYSNEQIKRVHKTGDCYVNFSRGEGWCIPAFDAMLYGKELITTKHTAMADWVDDKYAHIVESYKDSVHNMHAVDKTIYTAKECWYEPVIISGANAFREHFLNMKKNKSENITNMLATHDPVKIGNELKEIIYAKE